MKRGLENRNKTILAAVLGVIALICVYTIFNVFNDGPATVPPPSIAPPARGGVAGALNQNSAALANATPGSTAARGGSTKGPELLPSGTAAGVDAKQVASASTSLDPTLREDAMLRAEHLTYAGSGRNIFSATYVPEVKTAAVIPVTKFPVRLAGPQVPYHLPPPPTCPPSCPPINLKFFGTTTANGVRQAFLLQGDEVFTARQGDIVARKYKIVSIAPNSLQVEDLANNNTQTLPLLSN